MKLKKALVALVCAAALVTATFLGTMAYFTDQDAVTNTFTVGRVGISLDEADVNEDGTLIENADRVDGNLYHLIPGHRYIKDPTVTVDADSEDCYVRMFVKVNFSSELDAIFSPNGADLLSIFEFESDSWEYKGNVENTTDNTRTYEFWHKTKVTETGKLEPLFNSFTVPGSLTNEQLATLVIKDEATGEITSQLTFDVTAHAIQADGFATADAAWEAFPTNP